MPRILILSTTTGYQLRAFGDAAARTGIELVFATDRCHHLDDPWRDAAVPVRFHEEEASVAAIVASAEARPIDGILAVGDRPVVLASLAAEALGLPGNPPEAARASVHKRLARERFRGAGLPVPWFFEIPPDRPGPDRPVEFPCVIKPVGLSGSRGVIRADTPGQLAGAIERIRALLARPDVRAARTGHDDLMLVEGFIEGEEFAVEGLLEGGRFRPFAIFDKPDPLDGPFFEERIYVTPSALPEAAQHAIVDHIARAAAALGLTHGPLHAECRVGPGGVFVLEAAPRPIGGLCARVLQFRNGAGGGTVPLEEILLRHAAGEDVSACVRESQPAAVMMIPIPRRGILKGVDGVERAKEVPRIEEVRITAKQDQLLEPLPDAASYLGFIFARGGSRDELVRALEAAQEALTFRIAAPLPVVAP